MTAWKDGRQKSGALVPGSDASYRSGRAKPTVQAADVRAARLRLGMTQPAFAEYFGVALPTLRKWEQGARRPDGPARVLLRVIQTEPDAVRRALADDDT